MPRAPQPSGTGRWRTHFDSTHFSPFVTALPACQDSLSPSPNGERCPEDKGIADVSLETPVEQRKLGLAAFIVFVQVHESSGDALADGLQFAREDRLFLLKGRDEIEVRLIFLAALIIQDVRRLLIGDRNVDGCRNAEVCKLHDQIGL